MILYKYVSFGTGTQILEKNRVAFSRAETFNDPFDSPLYPYESNSNPAEHIFGRLHTMAKEHSWRENTGLLCLTRTPTNPLMWAHYADNHRGMVVGLDVAVAGLTDEKSNLIPAQYGSVIYVSGRPNQPFFSKPDTGLAVGTTHHFPHEHYEKLQRLFLHKPLCWHYEEEVRVLKCLNGLSSKEQDNQSGNFEYLVQDDGSRFLLLLPAGAIKEVYLGFRAEGDAADQLYYAAIQQHPGLSVFGCSLDMANMAVKTEKYMPLAEALSA